MKPPTEVSQDERHQDGVVVVAFAAFSDDLLTDGNSLWEYWQLEAGVDLGVGVGDFFECAAAVRTAPWQWGRIRGSRRSKGTRDAGRGA